MITTVIFFSNLNATAPKTSGRKLERRRSICVNTTKLNIGIATLSLELSQTQIFIDNLILQFYIQDRIQNGRIASDILIS